MCSFPWLDNIQYSYLKKYDDEIGHYLFNELKDAEFIRELKYLLVLQEDKVAVEKKERVGWFSAPVELLSSYYTGVLKALSMVAVGLGTMSAVESVHKVTEAHIDDEGFFHESAFDLALSMPLG